MGISLLAGGKIARAPAHFEKATTLYDPLALATTAPLFGQDPHVTARAPSSEPRPPGHLGRAREQRVRALEQARRLDHPVILAHTLALAAQFMQVVRDDAGLAADTDGLSTLASEQGFALFRAVATVHRGALLARAERPEAGIALLEQGIAAYRETDAVRELPFLLASLAEAHRGAGHREESLRLLDEALRLAGETKSLGARQNSDRLKGAILASDRGGREAEAEGWFEGAIAVARRQGARLWELRSAVGLARLRRDQGRPNEAHAMLAAVYGWFTRRVDAPDLLEAKALLDKLGAGPADGAGRRQEEVRTPHSPDRLRGPAPGR